MTIWVRVGRYGWGLLACCECAAGTPRSDATPCRVRPRRANALVRNCLPVIPARTYCISGGEGGIRTHVPGFPDHPISSRRRYDRFGTSPDEAILTEQPVPDAAPPQARVPGRAKAAAATAETPLACSSPPRLQQLRLAKAPAATSRFSPPPCYSRACDAPPSRRRQAPRASLRPRLARAPR